MRMSPPERKLLLPMEAVPARFTTPLIVAVTVLVLIRAARVLLMARPVMPEPFRLRILLPLLKPLRSRVVAEETVAPYVALVRPRGPLVAPCEAPRRRMPPLMVRA